MSQDEPAREVDLHGMRVEQAIRHLTGELTFCRARNMTPVLVIVGKGWNSPGGKPVMGPAIVKWLRGPEGRNLGVRDCQPTRGGGAYLVRIER